MSHQSEHDCTCGTGAGGITAHRADCPNHPANIAKAKAKAAKAAAAKKTAAEK